MSNITTALLRPGMVTKTPPLYQYDYGQVLQFTGAELPDVYEVHFSNSSHGEATTMIGGPDGVTIPDMYLTTGADVYVWMYLHAGDADGETEYNVIVPVIRRSSISDAPPTPVQQTVIEQAIALLSTASDQTSRDVTAANAAAESAAASAVTAGNAADRAAAALASVQAASQSAQQAATAAGASQESAAQAKAAAQASASAAAQSASYAEQHAWGISVDGMKIIFTAPTAE